MSKSILVIGAGIAGLSCLEALFQDYDEKCQYKQVVLLSETRLIKKVSNYSLTGRQLESFDVTEGTVDYLLDLIPDGLGFKFIVGRVKFIDVKEQKVVYSNGIKDIEINYDRLCICIGAKPRHLKLSNCSSAVSQRVIVIRDTDTVYQLQEKLKLCKKIVILGNGGIGLELVSTISDCHKTWIIRDESIGSTYFDSGAAKFLLDSTKEKFGCLAREIDYSEAKEEMCSKANYGPSLGPNWSQNLELRGESFYCSSDNLEIIYNDEAVDINENPPTNDFKLRVTTKAGKTINCDLVVLAIGVEPNKIDMRNGSLKLDQSDGGIIIDDQMRTSIENIYAAGDVVSCDNWKHSELWFQKRLWTQARQLGYYAGRCIAADLTNADPSIYFNFECFTHCTSFFGFRLILLGQYNGQNLDCDSNIRVKARVKKNRDYVKVIINEHGRIIGSVLVGDSGLEETIENLIHDKIDVSPFEDQLLDDTVDIEDYFD